MLEPVIFNDLTFTVCFHDFLFKNNMDWFMQSKDLTRPAFQAHQILVRFYTIDRDLKAMMKNGCEDLPEFDLYQRTLGLLSEDDAAKQREKISGFLNEDYHMLHKHFSCFAYPDILGAGMLAENPLAAVHARVCLGKEAPPPPTDPSEDEYYSEVHKKVISISGYDEFVRQKFKEALADLGHAYGSDSYDHKDLFHPKVLQAAEIFLSENFDVDFRDVKCEKMNRAELMDCIKYLWKRYLSIASNTQFVESCIKLIRDVSKTGAHEPRRNALAIIKHNGMLPFEPEDEEEVCGQGRLSEQGTKTRAAHLLISAITHYRKTKKKGEQDPEYYPKYLIALKSMNETHWHKERQTLAKEKNGSSMR